MTPAEVQMCWRMMCATMPAAIEITITPGEIRRENPDLDDQQILLIHQQACADMAWEYAYTALRIIRRKGMEVR